MFANKYLNIPLVIIVSGNFFMVLFSLFFNDFSYSMIIIVILNDDALYMHMVISVAS